jgi:hypothetical protein
MSGQRFPGYDVMSQREHWDEQTRAVVEDRLGPRESVAFFGEAEEATCRALLDRLLGLDARDRGLGVFEALAERLALGLTDGFRYEDMPADPEAWRLSLSALDDLASERHGRRFHELDPAMQAEMLGDVKTSDRLGPLPVNRLWSVWMRYACAAFYSQPAAWSEIGFGGPAYPRGFKNLGLDRREPWEAADAAKVAGTSVRKSA